MSQGILSFQYESERSDEGLTALAGIGVYLELIKVSGLARAVRNHVRVAGSQGWLDLQMVISVLAEPFGCGPCRGSGAS